MVKVGSMFTQSIIDLRQSRGLDLFPNVPKNPDVIGVHDAQELYASYQCTDIVMLLVAYVNPSGNVDQSNVMILFRVAPNRVKNEAFETRTGICSHL